MYFPHKHIIGSLGTGKTTLGLETDVLHLIYCSVCPLLILDCKGDLAFLQSVHAAARRSGRAFKCFSIGDSFE